MRTELKKAFAIALVMLCSAGIALALTPHKRFAELNRGLVLEQAIPVAFGDWRMMDRDAVMLVNPQQTQLLRELYSQLLTRSYTNSRGERVMLSIAYGGQQGKNVELHRPEVCYVAQGFSLKARGGAFISSLAGHPRVPVVRLLARQGERIEPVSYWMRVGDEVIPSGFQQQIVRIREGLEGWIPDGVLFRVSSISADTARSYAVQEEFAEQLLYAVDEDTRRVLIGPVRGGAVARGRKT